MGNNIEIMNESRLFTTVVVKGDLKLDDVKSSARVYSDLYEKGVKRILIDVSSAETDLGNLLGAHSELGSSLSRFDKIAIFVQDSKRAFKVKAASNKDSNIQVFYDKPASVKWLEE